MNEATDLGKLGAGLLLDARATRAGDIVRLDRFFAQFADDHLRGARHRFETVAPRVYLILVGPEHSALAAALGADLARTIDHLGCGTLAHRPYMLPNERKALVEAIASLRAPPANDNPASEPDHASRLDTALTGLDLSNFVRERPVHAIDERRDSVQFHDLDIDLHAIGGAVGINIAGNPSLAEQASVLIERRTLRDLPVSTRARTVPICVHFHSRFASSDFFEKSVSALPVAVKNRLVLDFSAGDVISNEKRAAKFFEDLHESGIAVSISQVEWARAEKLAPYAGHVAWFKGRFGADSQASHGLLVLGAGRCIAENLANLADAQAAVAAGFRNISGPGADVFMAARASAAARGGAEQPAAPAGRQ
ncbi:MAG: hypothetical protein JNN22_11915 [Rhodospirillales bacterium]|nr:hypothetical protein [Rhodospirillales bacterium]